MADQPINIVIKVDPDGNFTYVPALLRARPGDQISWSCDNGEFTVSFDQGTPFDDREFHSCPAGGTGSVPRRTAAQTIQARERRVYHYHVAVALPTGRVGKKVRSNAVKVYMDSGCPGIGT